MSTSHQFPTPWSVEEQDDCFVVRDRNGRTLRHVYFKHAPGRGSAAKLFTREEAEHIASNFAKLPELLQNTGSNEHAAGKRGDVGNAAN
jgi:hypothetical protein